MRVNVQGWPGLRPPGWGVGLLMLAFGLSLTTPTATPAATAVPAFTLNAGSVGGDLYSVAAYNAAVLPPGNIPTYNQTNGVLLSPGNGYGTLGAQVGAAQADFGGINNPTGNLALGLNSAATTATIPNALFGAGSLGYGSSSAGIFWSKFSISDNILDNNFSTSDSRGIASFTSNVTIVGGQAGIYLGVAGFLPVGTQGFASLEGLFTLTSALGVVKQRSEDAVLIYANNITGSGLPNGEQNLTIPPVAGGVNNGVISRTCYYNQVGGNGLALSFISYGVAVLPGVNYVPGDVLTIDGTLSLSVDPLADFEIIPLPLFLPDGTPVIPPDFGVGDSAVPEPASFVMYGTAIAVGLGTAWRRRRKARV